MQIRLLAATLALTIAASAVAQERVPFSAERSWQIQRIASPAVSPDGKTVVAAVTRYDLKDNKGLTDLWLWSADGKVERALTTNPAATHRRCSARTGSRSRSSASAMATPGRSCT